MNRFLLLPAIGGVLALSGCASNTQTASTQNTSDVIIKSPAKPVARSTPATQKIPANAQKISIDLPGGYKPGAASVKAGTPVAITFNLKSDAGCGNAIALPAAKWSKTLKVGESATVVYTPTKTGNLKFACSMDMMRGTLLVK